MTFGDLQPGDAFHAHEVDIGGQFIWMKIDKVFAKIMKAPDICPNSVGLKLSFNPASPVFNVSIKEEQ